MSVHPLLYLLLLRLRAVPRNLFLRPGSTKRLVMTILGVVIVVLWLAPGLMGAYFGRRSAPPNPERFQLIAPFALFALALTGLFSIRRGGIAFTPAEVNLLFPAPFSRRALLLYKLAATVPGAAFFALLFSIWFGRFAPSWPGAFAAAMLTSFFIQFLTVAASMALLRLSALAPGLRSLPHLAAGVLIAGLLLIAAQAATVIDVARPSASIRAVADLPAVRVLLAPFRVFVHTLSAESADALAIGLVACLAIDAALLLLILGLNADYLESAAAASERLHARIQRARRTGGIGAALPKRAAGYVPDLPFLAGAGPIIWFQLTRLRRYPTALLLPLIFVLLPVALLWRAHRTGGGGEEMILLGVMFPLVIFLVSALRFDFRADPEYFDFLKSLPIRPVAMTIGQLLVPVGVMCAIMVALLLAAALMGPLPAAVAYPVLAFTPVLCTILLGVDNLVYLLAPARPPLHGFDLQAAGRQAILGLARIMLLAIAGVPTVLVAWLVKVATDSTLAAGAAAWLLLAAAAAALIYAASIAFKRLDVSLDMPV